MTNATVKVWDPLLRLFHWSLVTSFAVAWLTGDDVKDLHEWAGYAAAALVAFRVFYGLVGPRYARFGQFLRGPLATAAYARDAISGRERRYLGHNPMGAVMVIALLAMMAALALTGWLMTTDTYWGVEWLKELHETLANVLLGLVGLHVAGVVLASFRHRENLVRAMITGYKRSPLPDDIA
ncbi:cytochrome B [Nordella sp. HKS 07]|uniref:cytochrome b/b6 domain-containing protein n=1 Tax=Nordella sp. HKS 07 TaxID=2712222 RepID=UPI0013E13DDE|nr:cytochrome b/b6 domain-containing protein [Nordella sp. HKS 07]QIG50297.1 cytochrome B [Nordella sp. HKS 07]